MSHALDKAVREKSVITFSPMRRHSVFGGTLVLTERRREVLFHIACTHAIWWRLERDWTSTWRIDRVPVPHLGDINVAQIMRFLRKQRLIRWRPGSAQAHVTPRGMDALLDIVCLKTN